MSDTTEQLLNSAECAFRTRGYHAVSFRDLAAELGIKSASVHYHFRRKEDLAVAVIDRYADRFFDRLNASQAEPMAAFCAACAAALVEEGAHCLCGVLGAEIDGLPEEVRAAVRAFFQDNLNWLTHHLGDAGRAAHVVATLQGGLLLAHAMDDASLFAAAISGLRAR